MFVPVEFFFGGGKYIHPFAIVIIQFVSMKKINFIGVSSNKFYKRNIPQTHI